MQENKCKEYAKKQGWEVIGTSKDKENGLNFNRDGLEKILEAAQQNKMNIILMQDISRLGRDLEKVTEYVDKLLKYNVKVVTTDLGEIKPPAKKILLKVEANRQRKIREFDQKYSL
jgi:DNA invertase Pin-like site-specific DNA recombinase